MRAIGGSVEALVERLCCEEGLLCSFIHRKSPVLFLVDLPETPSLSYEKKRSKTLLHSDRSRSSFAAEVD